MNRRKIKFRIGILYALLICFAVISIATLYDIQVVNGASYLEQSEKKIVKTVDVAASRGEITDRYGRVLVSNRISYNVSFDTSLLYKADDPNGEILRLIKVCDESGVDHTDTLPVSDPPYTYLADPTETQQKRFDRYLENKELSSDLSAEEIIGLMREEYEISEELSESDARAVIGVRYELELRELQNISAYIFVKDIDIDLITKIKEQDFTGVQIDTTTVREYNTEYAAHILGRVGLMNESEYEEYQDLGYDMDDLIGKSGIEKAYEEYLHGTDGVQVTESNTSGKITNVLYTVEPEPGDNIELTIDIKLQEVAEQSLAATIEDLRESGDSPNIQGGAVVVMDIDSGEVLALASNPSYSIETFSEDYSELLADPLTPLFNRATQGIYSPGSTFKMVTATAALEGGVITPSTTIYDKGQYTYYPDYQPKCWIYASTGGTHGLVNVVKAIEVSCNYFFYEVGRLTGIEEIDRYASIFGLGESTGIEIPENKGILAGPEYSESVGETWWPGLTLAAAIGQSDNSFTPLQLCSYIATLVNGGGRYSAHLLKNVEDYDYSGTLYSYENNILSSASISDQTIDTVKKGMLAVSQTGTASSTLKDFGITVGAKTGTAQTGVTKENNSVFVCFAPYDDPEIAIAIVVEKGGSGSKLAGIARDIMEYYFYSYDGLEELDGENELLK